MISRKKQSFCRNFYLRRLKGWKKNGVPRLGKGCWLAPSFWLCRTPTPGDLGCTPGGEVGSALRKALIPDLFLSERPMQKWPFSNFVHSAIGFSELTQRAPKTLEVLAKGGDEAHHNAVSHHDSPTDATQFSSSS